MSTSSKHDSPTPGKCGCCKVVKKDIKTLDDGAVGNKEAQEALVGEKAFDQTVARIKGSLSWATAGLLGTATASTISLSFGDGEVESVIASWVYVTILIIILVFLQTCALDGVDTPDTIGKELDTIVPPKKAQRGDKVAKYELEEKAKKQNKIKTDKSPKGVAFRVYKFAEGATDKFLENLVTLATAILANVVAVAFNAAYIETLVFIFNDGDTNLSIALYWVFAGIVLMVAVYVAVLTGKDLDDREIAIYDQVYKNAREKNIRDADKIWTDEAVYRDVIKFAARRRYINLINYALGLTVAWSVRDAFKTSIINSYDGETDTLQGYWIYMLFASLFVGFINSLCEKYYILYPRDKTSAFQLNTKERDVLGNSIYDNLQTLVGIAWYDAAVETSSTHLSGWTNVASLAIIYVLFLVASGVGAYYWKSIWIRFEMVERGAVTAIYNAFEQFWDKDGVLEIDEEEKEKSSLPHDFGILYLKEYIELSVAAWGVAAGWTASACVKAVLIETWEGTFDPDLVNEDISGDVLWSAWVAWFISLIISTLIMWFLSDLQKKRQEKRQAELKKATEGAAQEMEEKNVVLSVDSAGDDNDKDNDNDDLKTSLNKRSVPSQSKDANSPRNDDDDDKKHHE